jgi:hypothetical protein
MTEATGHEISAVREGMHVVDVDGEKVGTVKEVHFGDPGAVTSEGQDVGIGADDLPVGVRDRLLRTGYLRVHGGLFGGKRYASAEDVERVEGDVVHLSVTAKKLDH